MRTAGKWALRALGWWLEWVVATMLVIFVGNLADHFSWGYPLLGALLVVAFETRSRWMRVKT